MVEREALHMLGGILLLAASILVFLGGCWHAKASAPANGLASALFTLFVRTGLALWVLFLVPYLLAPALDDWDVLEVINGFFQGSYAMVLTLGMQAPTYEAAQIVLDALPSAEYGISIPYSSTPSASRFPFLPFRLSR